MPSCVNCKHYESADEVTDDDRTKYYMYDPISIPKKDEIEE